MRFQIIRIQPEKKKSYCKQTAEKCKQIERIHPFREIICTNFLGEEEGSNLIRENLFFFLDKCIHFIVEEEKILKSA